MTEKETFNWEDVKSSIVNRTISEDSLRDICIKNDIPTELRFDIWSILLYHSSDDVKFVGNGNLDKDREMSEILTLYCEVTKCVHTPNLNVVLKQIMGMKASQADKYGLFSAIMKNYLPMKEIKVFALLLRLILMYHDPVLSLALDGNRIQPEEYCVPWLSSLFADLVPDVEFLWDAFFARAAPFTVFFAVALLIKKREVIMETKGIDMTLSTKLEIFEVLKSAMEIERDTPISTKNQLESLLHPSGETDFAKLNQFYLENVILPIPTSEVVEAFRNERAPTKCTSYIIIDCRSLESFSFARLPTAIHIGTNIRYDEKKMKTLVKQFESAKGGHFTIFGTGRKILDEQNLLNLIAMKFIQNGFPHISIAYEGFKGCIKYISTNQIEYVRDEKKEETFDISETLTSLGTEIFGWGKQKLSEITKEKEPESLFSLEDGDEETHNVSMTEETYSTRERLVKLDQLKKMEMMHSFIANVPENPSDTRLLAIGTSMVLCLKPHPTQHGFAMIVWKRLLSQIKSITYKKENSQLVTFVLKGKPDTLQCEEDEGEFTVVYNIPESLKCIQTIQEHFINCYSSKTDTNTEIRPNVGPSE